MAWWSHDAALRGPVCAPGLALTGQEQPRVRRRAGGPQEPGFQCTVRTASGPGTFDPFDPTAGSEFPACVPEPRWVEPSGARKGGAAWGGGEVGWGAPL